MRVSSKKTSKTVKRTSVKPSTKTFKGRKATFVKTSDEKYRAVNRRAHIVVRKATKGNRSLITREQLLATKDKGSYRLYVYNVRGVLQPLRVR